MDKSPAQHRQINTEHTERRRAQCLERVSLAGRRGGKKRRIIVWRFQWKKMCFYLLTVQNKDRVPENVPTLWWKPSDMENVLEPMPRHTCENTHRHTPAHTRTHTHAHTHTQAYNRSSREKRQRTPIIEAFDAGFFYNALRI